MLFSTGRRSTVDMDFSTTLMVMWGSLALSEQSDWRTRIYIKDTYLKCAGFRSFLKNSTEWLKACRKQGEGSITGSFACNKWP